ncbi:hypothetical protein EW093_14195 [Thiospirochaeta perfilievii]|uniref:Uncharacterized protein n=1 Tax=Thiospirochaeta perfilievii TaxID=252967 RepID=A0A5C1QCH2_9SPIO|nr:hypothetical protein [Thiospirochaeta perfilievii]QEN05803.1 hypothetical protein EW093_14195 [Thiospirochaeta perfilievii]
MKKIGINVYITEGCRLTKESSLKLIKKTEEIFRSNGFYLSFPIISITYVEKILDDGTSIFDFNMDNRITKSYLLNSNPHFFSVEKHKEISVFPHNDTINLVLVKSLHDTGVDSWPNAATFEKTNTIFISETCYETTLAHIMMKHFGISDQYHNPKNLSYGCDLLRLDTKMSEEEKLILSEELSESVTNI